MKGIVFYLLEECVRREFGEDTWDELLSEAGSDGVFTSLGSYSDDELYRIVMAASKKLNITPGEVVRWFGHRSLPLMAQKYPVFFTAHTSTRSFILALNTIIHPEVRKLYPGADVPVFDFDTTSEEILLMGYSSKRKMCEFAEGLITGAAEHFGEALEMDQIQCMHRGDEKCMFKLKFSPVAGQTA